MPPAGNQNYISLCVRKISFGQLFWFCIMCIIGHQIRKTQHQYAFYAIEQKTNSYQNIYNIVLHVGPGKSGTSTIQRGLETTDVKGLLFLDNYTLIDNIELSHAAQQDREIEFLKNFFQNMVSEEMQQQPKQHIFGSSEHIKDPLTYNKCMEWKNLTYTSYSGINGEKKYWNLDIIIAYRRLHEYLPSLWNQYFKKSRIQNRIGQRHENWPGIDGDYRILSLE